MSLKCKRCNQLSYSRQKH